MSGPSGLAQNERTDTARPPLIVVAFGGNAIVPPGERGTAAEQAAHLRQMAKPLVSLLKSGWSVAVTHGNGPQIGNIQLQQQAGEPNVPSMPLDVAGAMSQGQIGYLLSQQLSAELANQGVGRSIAPILTRCVVDASDSAFDEPTKPVGPFYDEQTAQALSRERRWTIVADSGRGYRRTVPSPRPLRIVECDVIGHLVRAGVLVIACGGGGVPVVETEDGYAGVEAVIDKDLAACLLARDLGASALVLLTQVPEVCVDFGTPAERKLGAVTADELQAFAQAGHFPPGSMGPKVSAAIEFVRTGGERAIITSPDFMADALEGHAGTRISLQKDRQGHDVDRAVEQFMAVPGTAPLATAGANATSEARILEK